MILKMIVIYPVFVELFMIHYMCWLLISSGNMLYAVKGFLIMHFRKLWELLSTTR